MRSTANKSTTPQMIPSWQSRNFAWSGCSICNLFHRIHSGWLQSIEEMVSPVFHMRKRKFFFQLHGREQMVDGRAAVRNVPLSQRNFKTIPVSIDPYDLRSKYSCPAGLGMVRSR